MQGFCKGRQVRDSWRPVSFEMLLSLGLVLKQICADSYELCLFRAFFSLAFFGAFRVSELVSPSRAKGGGLKFAAVVQNGDSLD